MASEMILVFLDANVYFSGIYSRKGAASMILDLAQRGKFVLIATHLVLFEADRNLRKKTDIKTVSSFHSFLSNTEIRIIPPPRDGTVRECEAYINPKDARILAAALEAKVDYLITLDLKHFMSPRVPNPLKKMRILTPGEFLSRHFA